MSWQQFRDQLSQRKSGLDSQTTDGAIDQLIEQMNVAISRYTNTAGISANPDNNPEYATANEKFKQLATLQQQYLDLIKTLGNRVRQMADDSDTKAKLQQVGRIKQDIARLERELNTVKQESETSQARQGTVEKPRTNTSYYQGFSGLILFDRPLRPLSIPFLVAFGLLFLFFSGLMLREFFTPSADSYLSNSSYQEGGLFAVFTDARFYSVMAGVSIIALVVGILAWSGRLGKRTE
jgi:hypothetical protein